MRAQSNVDLRTVVDALAPRLARLRACAPVPSPGEAGQPGDAERTELLRRALADFGVECRVARGLTALEAFGIASERGREVTVAADLAPQDLALTYARCLVRLGLDGDASFATWFHYRPGLAPAHATPEERRATAVVDAMARALLAGRLEATPRYLLQAHAAEAGAASGLLGECSRALLGSLHRASSALYWRSEPYQALRASAPMVVLTSRVHALLSARAA